MKSPADEAGDSFLFSPKVFLEFGRGRAFVVGQVADNLSVLQQSNTCGDVHGMLQVMTGNDDGCTRFLGVVRNEML